MTTPKDFLTDAITAVDQRGTDNGYDVGQERSAARIAKVFNALTDHNLTEADVWTLLIVLKQVRNQHKFKHDNIVDMVGYAGLLGECLAAGVKPSAAPIEDVRGVIEDVRALSALEAVKTVTGHALDEIGNRMNLPRMETDHGCETDESYRERVLARYYLIESNTE